MESKDIRWQQRFNNYNKALLRLTAFINKGTLNEFEEQGLIKAFEYCYELARNTLKDFYESQGVTGLQGSKDVIRLAFSSGLIEDGSEWFDMLQSRIQTVHTYDEAMAAEVTHAIHNRYFGLFIALQLKLKELLHS